MVTRIRIFTLLFLVMLSCAFGNVKTLDIGATGPDFNLIGIDGKYYTLTFLT